MGSSSNLAPVSSDFEIYFCPVFGSSFEWWLFFVPLIYKTVLDLLVLAALTISKNSSLSVDDAHPLPFYILYFHTVNF